ncbi:unnamed protein product [Leptosia nina]|uniref:N-acetyltransferase domain-containing protein n=1 Tax=Leptosia nina TaxID=320188 RepID=A0AAV1J3T1_9NEOP
MKYIEENVLVRYQSLFQHFSNTVIAKQQRMAFAVRRVAKSDTNNVMAFLKRTFFMHEPLYKKIGYCKSENDDCTDLDRYCRYCLPGKSYMAEDASGNIIGVLISSISSVKDSMDYRLVKSLCVDPNFKVILDMVDVREKGAQLGVKYPNEKKLFEIIFAATDDNWLNRGVMKKLMEEAEKKAREKGLRLMRIDTTSAYSAKAAEKMGFKCIYKRAYRDINLIIPDPPHEYDQVYIKEFN